MEWNNPHRISQSSPKSDEKHEIHSTYPTRVYVMQLPQLHLRYPISPLIYENQHQSSHNMSMSYNFHKFTIKWMASLFSFKSGTYQQ
jgi:hypothetical protein